MIKAKYTNRDFNDFLLERCGIKNLMIGQKYYGSLVQSNVNAYIKNCNV